MSLVRVSSLSCNNFVCYHTHTHVRAHTHTRVEYLTDQQYNCWLTEKTENAIINCTVHYACILEVKILIPDMFTA